MARGVGLQHEFQPEQWQEASVACGKQSLEQARHG